MRVAFAVPFFGPGLTNGSEHLAYHLARRLVELGAAVDVYTTCTARARAVAPFALRWPADFPAAPEVSAGIRIRRFPVTFAMPAALARLASTLIAARWRAEERRYGVVLKGSAALETYYARRARSRPAWYDRVFLAGLGPWSAPLRRELELRLPDYDVVVTGFVPFALPGQVIRLTRRLGKPAALLPLFHPEDLFHHHRTFYEMFAEASAVLALTGYSAGLFRRLAPASRPIELGAGVEAEAYSRADISGARFRARYGLGDDDLVLFVGRKEPGKRYDLAVAAVERLARPGTTLVMVGEDVDRAPLRSARTRHLGKIPLEDLRDAYDACRVLLAPSEHESFGMVLLEAWMREKPVIGNGRCRPLASLIDEGRDGFVSWTADDMAERLRLLLDQPELARQMGQRGRQKVLRQYTWEVVGRKLFDILGELAAPHAGRA